MDDGGLGRQHVATWIGEGLARIDSVVAGEIESSEWGCEDWGARFSPDEATVYSLHDESCARTLSTSGLRQILLAWVKFIRRVPQAGEQVAIAI